jgi:outer membrane protein assembly factor BamE (lipoprotein component of BamABCDE complex)
LKDFDRESWVKEVNGCGDQRIEMVPQILAQKENLKRLQQPDIIELLGSPDKHELYKRNQKFFIYYTSCYQENKKTSYLQIRFNALGQMVEIIHYD